MFTTPALTDSDATAIGAHSQTPAAMAAPAPTPLLMRGFEPLNVAKLAGQNSLVVVSADCTTIEGSLRRGEHGTPRVSPRWHDNMALLVAKYPQLVCPFVAPPTETDAPSEVRLCVCRPTGQGWSFVPI